MTLEFNGFIIGGNGWTQQQVSAICWLMVMKKATAGISIS